jgi:hypothetical protein
VITLFAEVKPLFVCCDELELELEIPVEKEEDSDVLVDASVSVCEKKKELLV